MSQWRLETRPAVYGDGVVIIAHTTYNESWKFSAHRAGGTWKRPFDIAAWQFKTDASNELALRMSLEDLLRQCYPNQDEEDTMESTTSIALARRTPLVKPAEPEVKLNGTSSNGGSKVELTTAAIAEAVSKSVAKRTAEQAEQLKADVDRRLALNRDAMADAVEFTKRNVDAVNKRLDQVLSPTIVSIWHKDDAPVVTFEGIAHYLFPDLLELARLLSVERRNIWLAGPAGSGKTTAARQVAIALNRPFYFNGSIDTEYKLSGFIDAQGRIVSTAFRKAWEEGGVYLFDECDGSMASALLAFNAALANGHASFPDCVILRHPNTVVLAAANTYGWGGTANYIGRAKLDGAFLNRFSKLPWDYDEKLERACALAVGDAQAPGWLAAVQGTRKLAAEKTAKVIISPRQSIQGAELLAGGMSRKNVVRSQFCDLQEHPDYRMFARYLDSFIAGAT